MCKLGYFVPYKGFNGTINYNYSNNLYYGEIEDIDDVVTYQASNALKLHERYREVIDEYIDFRSGKK